MNEAQRDRAETTSPHFAAASVEEIRYAEYLRRQIEHRYLNKSDRASEHIGMSALTDPQDPPRDRVTSGRVNR